MRKPAIALALMLALITTSAPPAHANARLVRGVAKTFGSVLEIPAAIIQDSSRMIFPVGILTGTVRGAFNTVVGTLGGVADIAIGAVPYAKYGLLFI